VKELTQQARSIVWQRCLVERAVHQRDPAISGGGIDGERHVPHPQPGVPSLLHVPLRAAEASDEKVAQPLLGAGEILRRVHHAQHRIAWDLTIEATNQSRESCFTDPGEDLFFGERVRHQDWALRWASDAS
jgi:hypothetical protein